MPPPRRSCALRFFSVSAMAGATLLVLLAVLRQVLQVAESQKEQAVQPAGATDVQGGPTDALLAAQSACARGGSAVCFGYSQTSGFKTGRSGSRVGVLAYALMRAKEAGACFMRLSPMQRKQLIPVLNVTREFTDLTPWVRNCSCKPPKADHNFPTELCAWEVGGIEKKVIGGPASGKLRDMRDGVVRFFAQDLAPCPHLEPEVASDDTLVMHMRSGDVWMDTKTGANLWPDHMQPPCSFYTDALEHGNQGQAFRRGIIVTANAPDKNPCIKFMLERFPGTVSWNRENASLRRDSCRLVSARNLAIGASMFPMFLLLLNVHLKNVFVPFADVENKWPEWGQFSWTRVAMPYAQHLYSFPGFDQKSLQKRGENGKYDRDYVLQYHRSRLLRRTIQAAQGQ